MQQVTATAGEVVVAKVPDIDKLAKAAFDAFWRGFKTTTWEQQEEKYKENWRSVVKAVLEAKDQP